MIPPDWIEQERDGNMPSFDSRGKKTLTAILGAAFGCALSLMAGSAQAQTVVKFAHVGGPNSAFTAGAKAFAAKFGELTGGRYKVEEFGASALGNETQIIEGLKAGTIDLGLSGLAGPLPVLVPELGVIVIPNLFSGPEHAKQVLDGPIGQRILDAMSARGIVGLGLGDNGFRHVLLTTKVAKTPADLAGLKVRIPNSPTLEKVFKAWGAEPVAMNIDSVYEALKTGRVDGMENSIPNAASYRFFDFVKNVSMLDYAYSSLVFLASPDFVAELSDADKAALRQAGLAGAQATRDFNAAEQKKLMEELKGQGVSFHTDVDKAAFAAAVKPVQDELGAKYGDLFKQIIATK